MRPDARPGGRWGVAGVVVCERVWSGRACGTEARLRAEARLWGMHGTRGHCETCDPDGTRPNDPS